MLDLRVSPDFALPLDIVSEQTAILAKKGAGKSNAAVVEAEEMWDAGIPWVAIDPKGDWHGIRSSADGKGPGLPIPVFGGRHGDIPLEATAGALLADLILGDDDRGYLTCVIDVSQFILADQRRFLLAFGERLFQRKDEERVLHLFLEEAHEYLPQNVDRDQTKLVHAWQRIGKQGRFKGLGLTVISQRTAALNKDVLNQSDNLVVMRTMGPRDVASIREWLRYHVGADDLLSTLSTLAPGEAWLWSPEHVPDPRRFRFRQRRTFDSGATPKVGEVRRPPATIADVDLAAIKEAMADTIEKAKADDPKELRRRIARLERELRERPAAEAEVKVETVIERVEVPVLDEALVLRLEQALSPSSALLGEVQERLRWETTQRGAAIEFERRLAKPAPVPAKPSPLVASAPGKESQRSPVVTSEGATLPGPQRKLLTVLATYGPRSKRQLAMQSGYAIGGGAFNNPLGAIRSAGYVDPPRGEPMAITAAGLDALGDYEPLPRGRDLLDHWLASVPGPCRDILSVVADCWPDGIERDELAEAVGKAPGGGAFNNPLGRLRTLELLAKGWPCKLTDEFGEAIGG